MKASQYVRRHEGELPDAILKALMDYHGCIHHAGAVVTTVATAHHAACLADQKRTDLIMDVIAEHAGRHDEGEWTCEHGAVRGEGCDEYGCGPADIEAARLATISAGLRDYLASETDVSMPSFHATALTSRLAALIQPEDDSDARCVCGSLTLVTTAGERHDRGLHGADSCASILPRGWA